MLIDTVGGNTLATCVKACQRGGSVASCGLVASHELQLTVYPFLLNGINILGVDSAETEMGLRTNLWAKLGSEWRIPKPRIVFHRSGPRSNHFSNGIDLERTNKR